VSREHLLIDTLLELADKLVVEHDIVEYLYVLTERAVDVVGAAAAGVSLMNDRGGLEVAAASSYEMRQLQQLEIDRGEGPSFEAHRAAAPVEEPDLASTDRWPEFASQALTLGFCSVHARPLRLRGQPIGALDVFRRTPGPFSSDDVTVLGGLADMASIGIVHERALSSVERQVNDLQRALDRRAVVDQAMAVLADRLAIDHGTAFDWLRRYARAQNQRLRDVAQRFLNDELSPESLTPPGA
jgi:GAF domain-containing protein